MEVEAKAFRRHAGSVSLFVGTLIYAVDIVSRVLIQTRKDHGRKKKGKKEITPVRRTHSSTDSIASVVSSSFVEHD